MIDLMKIIQKSFVRLRAAAMNPFRRIVRRVEQLFNVNLITAKLITPINKKIRAILNIKPKEKSDYVSVGVFWISKKLIYFLILAACASVFIYFTWFAEPIADTVATTNLITTTYYDYDDLKMAEFSGKANIRAANGQVVYTGDIVSGMCTGVGTLWNQDGTLVYEGSFENNDFSGNGTLYYSNKKPKYTGGFAANVYSGTGISYYQDGTIEYEGEFQNGSFSGEGVLYDEKGMMVYSGNFENGNFSGKGTSYYANGVKRYEGEFYLGHEQGIGSLYSSTGKLLFTGAFIRGQIQYESLLGISMEEVLAMCNETPKVYYSGNTTAFWFEGIGVALETDCIVAVKKDESQTDNGQGWYLPGEEIEELLQNAGDDTVAVDYPSGLSGGGGSGGSGEGSSGGGSGEGSGGSGGSGEGSSGNGSSGEGSSGSGGSGEGSGGGNGGSGEGSGSGNGSSDSEASLDGVSLPDINTAGKYNVYYYLNSNEWKKESDLDYSQITVTRLATVNPDMITDFLEEEFCISSNGGTHLLECVVIDRLRMEEPTLFNNIQFTQTAKNSRYINISGIDMAAAIYMESYEIDNVRYNLCYEVDDYKNWKFITMEAY